MELRNFTPHPISIQLSDGSVVVVDPEPVSARLTIERISVGELVYNHKTVPVVQELVGEVAGLPVETPGVLNIVSRIVLDACGDRNDLVCPTDFYRDGAGHIVAARALTTNSADTKTFLLSGDIEITSSSRITEPSAPDHLVVLAGGNPVPNLQAIATLAPKRVTVLASAQTEQVAKRIQQAAALLPAPPKVAISSVSDANNRSEVERAIDSVDSGWALCYSGGTKVMAATVRSRYDVNGDGRKHFACIADSRLRCDDGSEIALGEGVTLRAIASLHGHRMTRGTAPTVRYEQLAEIAGDLRSRIKSKRPSVGRSLVMSNTGQKIPKPVRRLVTEDGGKWFEQLVAAVAVDLADEVRMATFLRLGANRNEDPELDVLVRNGWDVTLLTCTLEAKRKVQKLKLFEAQRRVEQLAGGRARCALVCLATAEQRESLVADATKGVPGGPQYEVFGRNEVLGWIAGDTASLRRLLGV